MYQKDFILRMIEMLANLLAGILGLIKKGDFQKAAESLENAYTDFLKQDAALFHNISKDQLIEILLKEHNYTNGHLEILAELFNTEASLKDAMEKHAESREFYEKALILFEFIEKESGIFSLERLSKITYIQNRLERLKEELN